MIAMKFLPGALDRIETPPQVAPARMWSWPWLAAFGLAYLLAAELGHLLTVAGAPMATLWPAAGLYVGALLLVPAARWPALTLVALVANFGSDTLLHGHGALVSLGFCATNTAAALSGASLTRRLMAPEDRDRPPATPALLVGAVLAGPALGATLGAVLLQEAFGAPFGTTWTLWWAGDALGVIVVAPLLFGLLCRWRPDARLLAECLGAAAAAAALAAACLLAPGALRGAYFLVVPAMIWGAMRGGSHGAAAALLGAAASLGVAASLGAGHMGTSPLGTLGELARAQVFLIIAGGTCHLLAELGSRYAATRHRAEAAEARLRRAMEGAGMATFDTDHDSGQGIWSRSRFEMLGYPPPEGLEGEADTRMWRDRLHPDDREATLARLAEAHRTAEPYRTVHRILRADDGRVRWVEAHGRFLNPAHGRTTREGRRNVGVVFDVTARVEAEERERLLLLEVENRARNALQVVRSLLHVTPFADHAAFVAAVEDRLAAMGRADTLLSGVHWTGADLREIAMVELGHLAGDGTGEAPHISLEGPPGVRLRSEATQAMSLVLHELATNAAKFGALSARGGIVRLYWQATPSGGASLRWSEQGGPSAGTSPDEAGFGFRLIATTVRDHLGGTVEFRWRREGLLVEIDIAPEHLDATPELQVPQKVR